MKGAISSKAFARARGRAKIVARWGSPAGGILCAAGLLALAACLWVPAMSAASGADQKASRLAPNAAATVLEQLRLDYHTGWNAFTDKGTWVVGLLLSGGFGWLVLWAMALDKPLAAYCVAGLLRQDKPGLDGKPLSFSNRQWAVLYGAWKRAQSRSRLGTRFWAVLLIAAVAGTAWLCWQSAAQSFPRPQAASGGLGTEAAATLRRQAWMSGAFAAILWYASWILALGLAVFGRELTRQVPQARLLLKLHRALGDPPAVRTAGAAPSA